VCVSFNYSEGTGARAYSGATYSDNAAMTDRSCIAFCTGKASFTRDRVCSRGAVSRPFRHFSGYETSHFTAPHYYAASLHLINPDLGTMDSISTDVKALLCRLR